MEELTKTVQDANAVRDKRNPPCITVTGKVLVYTADAVRAS